MIRAVAALLLLAACGMGGGPGQMPRDGRQAEPWAGYVQFCLDFPENRACPK